MLKPLSQIVSMSTVNFFILVGSLLTYLSPNLFAIMCASHFRYPVTTFITAYLRHLHVDYTSLMLHHHHMHFLPRTKLLSYLNNETQKRNVCLSSYVKRSPACLAYYVSTETECIGNRLGVKAWKFQRTTNLLDLPITSKGC